MVDKILNNKYFKIISVCISFFSIYAIRGIEQNIPSLLRNGIKLTVIAIILILYFNYIKNKKKINKFLLLYFVFWLYIFVRTCISNGISPSLLYAEGLITFSSIMFIELLLNSEDKKLYLISIYYFLLFLFILDFIIVLINSGSQGIFNNSNHNFVHYIVLWITEYIIFTKYKIKKFGYFIILSFLITSIESFLQNAHTTFVCSLLWYFYLYVVSKYINKQKISKLIYNKYFFLSFFILVFLLFIWAGEKSPVVPLLDKLFRVPSGMSGRSLVYENAKELFLLKPFFGYGQVYSSNDITDKIGFAQTHNFFLQCMVDGGLIALGLFFGIIVHIFNIVDDELDIVKKQFVYFALYVLILRITIDCRDYKTWAFTFAYLYNYIDSDKKYIKL